MPEPAPTSEPVLAGQPSPRRDLARAFAGVFVLSLLLFHATDQVLRVWNVGRPFQHQWGLDGLGVFRGKWWTAFTYPLPHLDLFHLGVNAGALALFGLGLSEDWSWRRLATLTLVSGAGGAGLWLAFHHGQRGMVIGASAIVAGYVTAFVLTRPRARVPLLGTRLGFPRWVLLAFLVAVEGLGLLREAKGRLERGALSHSAHLGGMIAATALCFPRKSAGKEPLRGGLS